MCCILCASGLLGAILPTSSVIKRGAREIVPAETAFISAANALLRSLSASVSSARSLTLCSGSASRFPWFVTKNVAFPDHIFAHIYEGEIMRNARNIPYVFCVSSPFSESARRIFCVAVLGTAPFRLAEMSTAPYGRFI
jgi:hypothetical protein